MTLVTECRFRWVACQLDALQKSRSVNELHRTLQSLPKTLELTYERILSQIDENDRHRARALLYWLAYRDSSHATFSGTSSWMLTRIAEAVAVTPDKNFEPRDRFQEPRELLDIASSLISVDKPNHPGVFLRIEGVLLNEDVENVQLAHASVLEYLGSAGLRNSSLSMFHISPEKAHTFLAKSCLRYLLFFDDTCIDVEDCKSWSASYPMLHYAATSWAFHLRQIQVDTKSIEEIYALALEVLDANSQCFNTWQTVASLRSYLGYASNLSFRSNLAVPFTFALQNRLPGLFKALIENGHDPSEEETLLDSPSGYLFKLAIHHHQPLSAEILFGRKIYLDKIEYDMLQECLDLALHLSSQPNFTKALVLLVKGPDLEAEHEISHEIRDERVTGTAIHGAIFQGEERLLELLVEIGANPNALCYISRGDHTIALAPSGLWSMVGEHFGILDFLLANGAQTNFTNKPLIMPPLVSHISRFRVKAARSLLEHGADIHYHGKYGTPLYHAAHLFDKRLELMLREAGAQDVPTVAYWVGL
jgi:hypothetical protein